MLPEKCNSVHGAQPSLCSSTEVLSSAKPGMKPETFLRANVGKVWKVGTAFQSHGHFERLAVVQRQPSSFFFPFLHFSRLKILVDLSLCGIFPSLIHSLARGSSSSTLLFNWHVWPHSWRSWVEICLTDQRADSSSPPAPSGWFVSQNRWTGGREGAPVGTLSLIRDPGCRPAAGIALPRRNRDTSRIYWMSPASSSFPRFPHSCELCVGHLVGHKP